MYCAATLPFPFYSCLHRFTLGLGDLFTCVSQHSPLSRSAFNNLIIGKTVINLHCSHTIAYTCCVQTATSCSLHAPSASGSLMAAAARGACKHHDSCGQQRLLAGTMVRVLCVLAGKDCWQELWCMYYVCWSQESAYVCVLVFVDAWGVKGGGCLHAVSADCIFL
jgi:hypothetical protein